MIRGLLCTAPPSARCHAYGYSDAADAHGAAHLRVRIRGGHRRRAVLRGGASGEGVCSGPSPALGGVGACMGWRDSGASMEQRRRLTA